MQNLLAISALGPQQPGVANDLAKMAADCACNILDCRMTVLGSEIAVSMLLSGNWNALAKFEHALPAAAARLQLQTLVRRTSGRENTSHSLPYSVQIVALDSPGILRDISQFFLDQGIAIQDLYCNTGPAPQTGAPMLIINLAINVPGDVHIAALRDQFLILCDDLNLDAVMEPLKS